MLLETYPILSKHSSLILIILLVTICFPLHPCASCSSYFHLTFPNIHQSIFLSVCLVSICISLYIYCISVYLSFKSSSRQFSSNFSPLQINSNSLELPFLPFFNLDLFSFQSSLSPCPPFFILLSPLFPHFFLGTIPYYILYFLLTDVIHETWIFLTYATSVLFVVSPHRVSPFLRKLSDLPIDVTNNISWNFCRKSLLISLRARVKLSE